MTCKYEPVERWGLYVMVILCLLGSCSIDEKCSNIIDRIDKLEIVIDSSNLNENNNPLKEGIKWK